MEGQGDNQDGDSDGRALSVEKQFHSQKDLDEIPPKDNRKETKGDTQSEVKGLEPVELLVDELSLSQDVSQFKLGANNDGVVERLGGTLDRSVLAPITVWERMDGRKEVKSGRHRCELAKRTGEKTIPMT